MMPKRRARAEVKEKETELAAEAEGPTLYCHCKLPYDDSRVMIACEICGNWFHFDCVGVADDQVKKVKNFMCRNCQADGFLGSAGEEWFLEPMPAAPVGPAAKKAKVTQPSAKPKPKPKRQPEKAAKSALEAAAKEAQAATQKRKPKSEKMSAEDTLRGKVRAKLLDALRAQGGEDDVADSDATTDVDCGIEAALFELCGGISTDYKTRARNLAFNLSDKLNHRLRHSGE